MSDERMDSFIREYGEFKRLAQEQKVSSEEMLQLFAIFRKDGRMETIRNAESRKEAITSRQLAYIKRICDTAGLPFSDEFPAMTKLEASKWIDSHAGG